MPDPELHLAGTAPRNALRALLPATLALLAGCAGVPAWDAGEDTARAASAEALAHEAAQQRLHTAVQAAQPGQDRLATARRALDSLLADDRTEARVLHPYARALLEQIRERQRLSAQNERLARELDERARGVEASSGELELLRRQNAELQNKLDALTDIERRLSPPAPARPDGSG